MKFNFDGNKLYYHPKRVSDWLTNEFSVFPIYIEISLSNFCNHACIFCALDFCLKQTKNLFATDRLLKLLDEFADCKVKSILYAGTGEPMIHKDIMKILNYTASKKIDTAINTNMVLYTPEKIKESLHYLVWLRASIDAGSKKTYALIHNTKESDFDIVLKNLEYAVKSKNDKKLNVTIGTQFLLINQNKDEVLMLAKILKDIGVDYYSIKPYNQHYSSSNNCTVDLITTEFIEYLNCELKKLQTEKFNIIFRKKSFEKTSTKQRDYQKCYGPNFITHLREDGNIYFCESLYNYQEYILGNIYKNSFKEIWLSENRKKIFQKINDDFEYLKNNICRPTCRNNSINNYLWQLKNPEYVEHINFI
ncbi:MAG TPA: radical SAM protein [bacterium]|nr:radical SAM protein [bacterium]HPP87365.1 radical SAM protein [bacterium]